MTEQVRAEARRRWGGAGKLWQLGGSNVTGYGVKGEKDEKLFRKKNKKKS